MSMFDDPYEAERRHGCICGRHASPAEHEHHMRQQLQCVAVESEDRRYRGVIASAAMRAAFPRTPRRG